jgi:hypothetical protein
MAVLFASALELDAGSQGATSSTAGTGYQPRPQCICGIASRSAGTRLVKQTLAAFFQKSATPLANCVFVKAELGSNRTPSSPAAVTLTHDVASSLSNTALRKNSIGPI